MPDGDPLDYSAKYNTQLSPTGEQSYQQWVNAQSQAVGRNVANDSYDYDLRGWFQANGPQNLSGAHLTDQFKKPNHPTFSDESQYSGVNGAQGGHWDVQPDNSYAFTPGSTSMLSTPELQDYFNRVEPTNTLNLPPT